MPSYLTIFVYESLEDTLSFAESIGWVEPNTEEWDGTAADEIEYDALRYIEDKGYVVKSFEECLEVLRRIV